MRVWRNTCMYDDALDKSIFKTEKKKIMKREMGKKYVTVINERNVFSLHLHVYCASGNNFTLDEIIY